MARTDTERLDWLADQHKPNLIEPSTSNPTPCLHGVICNGTQGLREAIDAAMDAEEEPDDAA